MGSMPALTSTTLTVAGRASAMRSSKGMEPVVKNARAFSASMRERMVGSKVSGLAPLPRSVTTSKRSPTISSSMARWGSTETASEGR